MSGRTCNRCLARCMAKCGLGYKAKTLRHPDGFDELVPLTSCPKPLNRSEWVRMERRYFIVIHRAGLAKPFSCPDPENFPEISLATALSVDTGTLLRAWNKEYFLPMYATAYDPLNPKTPDDYVVEKIGKMLDDQNQDFALHGVYVIGKTEGGS